MIFASVFAQIPGSPKTNFSQMDYIRGKGQAYGEIGVLNYDQREELSTREDEYTPLVIPNAWGDFASDPRPS